MSLLNGAPRSQGDCPLFAEHEMLTAMETVHQAFRTKDPTQSAKAHKHKHGHKEHHTTSGEYLGDMVLGGTDGIITTFAVVAGVVGAQLSSGIIIVLGLANLIADGFSMAVGNFLGTKSDRDFFRKEREREAWEVDNLPEHERAEIHEIFEEKGFKGELLENVVAHVTSDKKLWVDTMMQEELGLTEDSRKPILVGFITFVAFMTFGSVPLIVYVVGYLQGNTNPRELFPYSVGATGLALFMVGALRSKFTFRPWFRSGVEILLVGGAAGGLSYAIGNLLRGMVGGRV